MKKTILFLLAVALVFPVATALNCTALVEEGYSKSDCKYVDATSYSKREKMILLDYISDKSGEPLKTFKYDKNTPLTIKLDKFDNSTEKLSDDNKEFLIDLSSLSLFGYVIYEFLRKTYLLGSFI